MYSINAKIIQTLPCYNERKRSADLIREYQKEIKSLQKYDLNDWHIVAQLSRASQNLLLAIERSKFLNELLLLEYEHNKNLKPTD